MRALATRIALSGPAAAVLVLLPPDTAGWGATARALRSGGAGVGLDRLAALLAGTGLWCLAVWVLVAVAAGQLAALPGAVGAVGRAAVRVCVPRVLRGLVLGGVAGGLALGPAAAAVATPVWPTSPPAPAASTPGPAWPTGPAAASPTAPKPAPAPTAPEPAPSPGPADVVVVPGDSLWSITAHALSGTGDEPTPARVAAAWPAWYAANRAAIGPDPGLLRPGTHLTVPTAEGTTP